MARQMAQAIRREAWLPPQPAAPRAKVLRQTVCSPVPEVPPDRPATAGCTGKDVDLRAASVGRVGRTCHDVNSALTAVTLCIEFLAEQSHTVGHEAVEDALASVRRISTLMSGLRDDLGPEDSSGKT
jgi:hypothetical protein